MYTHLLGMFSGGYQCVFRFISLKNLQSSDVFKISFWAKDSWVLWKSAWRKRTHVGIRMLQLWQVAGNVGYVDETRIIEGGYVELKYRSVTKYVDFSKMYVENIWDGWVKIDNLWGNLWEYEGYCKGSKFKCAACVVYSIRNLDGSLTSHQTGLVSTHNVFFFHRKT